LDLIERGAERTKRAALAVTANGNGVGTMLKREAQRDRAVANECSDCEAGFMIYPETARRRGPLHSGSRLQ
jgi:hypothetical protein